MRELIIELISKQMTVSPTISDDEDLFLAGLNSIKFIHLIVDLELKFDMEVSDNDLTFETFSTIQKIMQYVHLKSPISKK
ncbi:phosphopantetheine-binding protein [Paenibacillus sp. FSL H8-0537]|uniref:phosphopantetheine-binding protein n=1 Tax=Paenibacillus sp. FSL H8-0537 TaxID=2921399 RepID=UPI003100FCC2